MSPFDDLQDACADFSNQLEKLHVGAGKYETEKRMEEKVLLLKEMNQMVTSQARVTKLASLQRKSRAPATFNVEVESKQMLTDVLKRNLKGRYTNEALMGHAVESVLTSEEPKMQIFKKKVLDQLEYLRTTNEELKTLNEEQLNVLDESLSLRKEIMLKQYEYSEALKRQKEGHEPPELSSAYTEQLDAMKQKIAKINFMSALISKLSIYGDVKWKDRERYMELIEEARTKHTVESILEL